MKKTKKIIVALVTTAITLSGVIGLTSSAQTDKRSANIKSKGIIDFQNGAAVISSSDLNYLADEIDLLEDTYKTETVNALNQVGTFYKLDGTTTFNPEESTLASSDASILPFSAITDGIINSQSIPAERTYLGTLPGGTEMNGNISAATAENLSLGTAAWVDGELIVGTGADNNSYYNRGYADGYANVVDSASISYAYHEHKNGNNQVVTTSPIYATSNPGGCYKAAGHTHNATGTCSSTYIPGKTCGGEVGWVSGPSGTMDFQRCCSCGALWSDSNNDGRCDAVTQAAQTIWHCGSPTNTWTIQCGKTEKTIESATITFK